jgi:hypothetical protein
VVTVRTWEARRNDFAKTWIAANPPSIHFDPNFIPRWREAMGRWKMENPRPQGSRVVAPPQPVPAVVGPAPPVPDGAAGGPGWAMPPHLQRREDAAPAEPVDIWATGGVPMDQKRCMECRMFSPQGAEKCQTRRCNAPFAAAVVSTTPSLDAVAVKEPVAFAGPTLDRPADAVVPPSTNGAVPPPRLMGPRESVSTIALGARDTTEFA